jgi:hypothetical protein
VEAELNGQKPEPTISREERKRRSNQWSVPLPFLVLSGLLAFTGFRDTLGVGNVGAVVIAAVLLVQFLGVVVGWRKAPTGKLRLAICGAFVAAGFAVTGLIVADLFSRADDGALWIFYATLIFGLGLQGYYYLWRGRA